MIYTLSPCVCIASNVDRGLLFCCTLTSVEPSPKDRNYRDIVAPELFCPRSYEIKKDIEQNNSEAAICRSSSILCWE